MGRSRVEIGDCAIELVEGDITDLEVDAIVNAANGRLRMGGGVAGAIARRGGPGIQEECDMWIAEHGPVPVGGAAITGAGLLRAKHVIHAVGPVWGEGGEGDKLRLAFNNSMRLAEEHGVKSIAFPAISAGIFGVPKEISARSLLSAALDYIGKGSCGVPRIIFCLYGDAFPVFSEMLEELAG